MAESRGSYERRRPALPRRYTVGERGRIYLGRPVADALDVEPGDEVTVKRNDRDEVVLEAGGGER